MTKKYFNMEWLKQAGNRDPEIRALAKFLESQEPHRFGGYHHFRDILEEIDRGWKWRRYLDIALTKWYVSDF